MIAELDERSDIFLAVENQRASDILFAIFVFCDAFLARKRR